ncbi:hypothetical protein CRI94_07210 [Longibacter salinarum]|uniref:Uncharacterized protein n=1 Tax=Longibacter salinarum TaxID=1850348 RepID=A0A2A8CZ13_9BACT|nr:hypothetical protein [Longibacter salinarum]PEN13843.1 hypothetical protein CRI94_07210 [Longibacter salinarum]
MHVQFRSRSELDDYLARGSKEDTFEYVGPDRVLILHNDCRRYPLRLEMKLSDRLGEREKEKTLYAFVDSVRSTFEPSFSPYLGSSLRTQIPGLAVKMVVFFSLGRVEVVFRKGATKTARRRVIGWLVGEKRREPSTTNLATTPKSTPSGYRAEDLSETGHLRS